MTFGSGGMDQYYSLTAKLAARGGQRITSRLIATIMFGLGAVPLLVVNSSATPRWTTGRWILVLLAAGCFGMGLVWLRHYWPSRRQSVLLVGVGTLCIAAGCVIPADSTYGMAAATAFALVSGYAALFHTLRVLGYVWLVALVTIAYLTIRIADHDLYLALAGFIVVVSLNVFSAFTCRTVVELTGTDTTPRPVEPLTGLLTRESFDDLAATLLASRSRGDDRYLVIVVVGIDHFAEVARTGGVRGAAAARIAAGQALRENVRRDAVVGHVDESEFLIADTWTVPDPSPLIERVRGAIAATPLGITVSQGAVSTPLRPLADRPPQEVLNEIVSVGRAAMQEAARGGGNQARYVMRSKVGRDTADDDSDLS